MKSLLLIPCLVQVIESTISLKAFQNVKDRKPPSWAPTIETEGSLSLMECAARCAIQNDCVGFTFIKGNGQCKIILKDDMLNWNTMDKDIRGTTYTTYVDPSQIQVIEETIPSGRFVKVTDRKPPRWTPAVEIKGSSSEVQCASGCESQNDCVGFTVEKRDGQCKLILKHDKLRWYTMDRNVTGITYMTYIDTHQVNSNDCDLVNVMGIGKDGNYGPSAIKHRTGPGNCRKHCEEISGTL